VIDHARRRRDMVAHDLAGRGVRDPRVLAAMEAVPREEFVGLAHRDHAYADRALPIEDGQTISQPFVVAFMIEALDMPADGTALEIGTGSGYAAAVLSLVCARVVTVERIARLAGRAAERLARLGYADVEVHLGDGTLGWPPDAPYDGIVATAGGPSVPEALVGQLAPGGFLVMPVGPLGAQHLVRVRRVDDGRPGEDPTYEQDELGGVAFVPLIGAQGWPA
jgi:protein-L-isoaspartate(D-aspartate) O-methyltransferase